MNQRSRMSTPCLLSLLLLTTVSAPVLAQTAGSAEATSPPPAGDLSAPATSPPSIVAPPPMDASAARPAPAKLEPVKIDSPSTTIKFGFLAQPQYEALGAVNDDGLAHNLFVRRTRILVGGTLFGVIDYFFDTDFPNLFKGAPAAGAMGATPTTLKLTPGMNIQDAFVTFKPMKDVVKVDVGYMLPPLSHNAIQGAGTLYGWDYFGYTFQHNLAFGAGGNPVGRDAGVQLRGLVLDGRLEYRAGLFQGLRNAPTMTEVGSRNFFRAAGRVQVNLLDPEPGFFYAGTYLGAKKILSLGASFDVQDGYVYWAVDGFGDLPLGPGILTAQINLAQWNAGKDVDLIALPKQTALMSEVGYTISSLQLSPILRFEQLWGTGMVPNQNRFSVGAAFWPFLHNSNLKAFYTRITQEGAEHGANQVVLQWQVYFF